MASLTAANAVIFLGVAGIFSVPQQLQGFDVDDVFSTEAIDTAETKMGVDGTLSAGYVPMAVKQAIYLQADSASNGFFETWYTSELAAKEKFFAFGIVTLSAVGREYTMARGVLTSYQPTPNAKKILQPRKFEITWETVVPAPIP